jgi:hypothetical protein
MSKHSISTIEVNPTPDWTQVWTSSQAEKKNLGGFKFTGPGWYINEDGSAMLVAPVEAKVMPFVKNFGNDIKFRFYVYDRVNVCTIFNMIADAPVRVDKRKA